jgi:hypothetical protein
MNYKIEMVAQAIYEAEHEGCLWANEPAIRKDRFREHARNAINLLGEDIGVLLVALEDVTAEVRMQGPRAAA